MNASFSSHPIMYLSLLREEEYSRLRRLRLSGKVLDLGACKNETYHRLLHLPEGSITAANMRGAGECDIVVDLEAPLSIPSSSYDAVICLNVLEHVYHFQNVVAESARILVKGGTLIMSVPFLFNIHGSPNDYFRYTKSAIEKLLSENGFADAEISEIGHGFFSLVFQIADGPGIVRVEWLRRFFKKIAVGSDRFLSRVSPTYARMALRIPLGYFVTAKKKI